MKDATLAAKVKTVNNCNSIALQFWRALNQFFAPYVRNKICDKKGNLLKSIQNKLPKFEDDNNKCSVLIWGNSLLFIINTSTGSFGDPDFHSRTKHFHIGYVDNQSLKSLYEVQEVRCDYTEEEVRAAQNRYHSLMEEAKRVKYDYYHSFMGEFD